MEKSIFKELAEICDAQKRKALAEEDEDLAYHYFLVGTLLNENDFAKVKKEYAVDMLASLLDDENAAKELYKKLVK